MPIDLSFYHPKWNLISLKIRLRAQNKCERCNVPNYAIINRKEHNKYILHFDQKLNQKERNIYNHKVNSYSRIVKIILTVAHLDWNPENNKFDNLLCLCQKCHFSHDRKDNIKKRKFGKYYKYNQYSLFI